MLLRERGALDEAAAAYGRAQIAVTTLRALDLGLLFAEHGALVEAEAAFRSADERGDAGASFNLGVLFEDVGRWRRPGRRTFVRGSAATTRSRGWPERRSSI